MSKTSSQSCAFCLVQGRLTKEHFIPRWLRQRLDLPEGQSLHTVSRPQGGAFFPGRPHDEMKGRLFRPGGPGNQTLRCVCEDCNNRWMSRLQDEARPLLTPLVDGEWRVFPPDQRRTLAAWVAMTAMVIEYADPETVQVPQGQRTALRDQASPPAGWWIYYARYAGGDFDGRFHHRSSFLGEIGTRMADIPADRRMQVTTFAAGKVIFAAVSGATPDLLKEAGYDAVEFGKAIRFAPLWPEGPSLLIVTPPPLINDFGARAVADQFGYIPMAPTPELVGYSARKRVKDLQAKWGKPSR